MQSIATIAPSQRFLVALPQAERAGTPETATARGEQLHNRLQTLQSTLVALRSDFDSTNLAIATSVGIRTGAFFGVAFTPMAGWAAGMPGWRALLIMGGASFAIAGLSGVLHLVGERRHAAAIGKKGDAQAAQVADVAHAFRKLSGIERDVVAYRALCLMKELGIAGARSPQLRARLEPMMFAYNGLTADQKDEARDLANLIDAIMLPTGELAPATRGDTERLIQKVESLAPEARDVLANLVRGAVQIAVDTNDGHRWRLRRLLEALDGKRTPYRPEHVSEDASTGLVPASPNQEVTLDRCITLLKGGLAVERAADDPARGLTKIIPSSNPTLAEQTAAYFERAGYRAAIFDDGNRLLVSVFNCAHPPSGAFVRGEES